MLLPLPLAKVREMSIEHHLALATLYSGRGNIDQINVLLKVVYLAYFMAVMALEPVDLDMLRAAEAAVECCGLRGHRDENWTLTAADHALLAPVLALHNRQWAQCRRGGMARRGHDSTRFCATTRSRRFRQFRNA